MAVSKIEALRTWRTGDNLTARSYVYERDILLAKINELIDSGAGGGGVVYSDNTELSVTDLTSTQLWIEID